MLCPYGCVVMVMKIVKINKHKKSDDKNLFHWDILSLGEIFDGGITGTSVVSESRIRENGEAGILKISAVSQGKFLPNEHKAITEEIRENLSAFPLKDTVLVSRANTQERVGESAYIENDYPDLFLPDKLWMFKVKDSSRDLTRFYSYVIQSDWFRQKVSDKATGTSGSMKNISRKNFLDNLVPRPPYFDQKNITEILVCVDNAIAITEKLITAKRRLKQGLMQKLLTGKARFPKFKDQFSVDNLGKLSQIKTGGRDLQNKVEDGIYPFFVRSDSIHKINSYSYDGEAILIPGEGRIGEVFHYINGRFDYHQRVYKISDFSPQIRGRYLYFYLQFFFKREAIKNSVKATVDSLRLPMFLGMQIKYPTIQEQDKIIEILNSLEFEIENLNKRLTMFIKQKQGLMQQLLTGKIRIQTP
jgi:type I restriction enzyme, S subunit